MELSYGFTVFLFVCNMVHADDFEVVENESARAFLERYNREAPEVMNQYMLKAWTYNTNLTDYNSQQMVTTVSV